MLNLKKITRKEIKRDPFLETIDKFENSFENNKKTFLNIVLAILAEFYSQLFIEKASSKEY